MHITFEKKGVGWDSAGGTVTHNLTIFYRIGVLSDLYISYTFVSFSSKVSFWRIGTVLPNHRRFSLSALISLLQEPAGKTKAEVYIVRCDTSNFKTISASGARCMLKQVSLHFKYSQYLYYPALLPAESTHKIS